MDLTGIISITGIGGLSKVIAKTKSGLIAESMVDKKRFPVHSNDKISALQDISVYTEEGEHPLREILKSIRDKEKGGVVPVDIKDAAATKKYFEAIVPTYDRERVYNSDIKKILTWYNLLQAADLLKDVEGEAAGEKATKKVKADTGEEVKEKKAKVSKPKGDTVTRKATSTAKISTRTTVRKTGA